MNKAVFLDRDGVLNYDSPNYVFDAGKFQLYPDVFQTLKELKSSGFRLIVITNQAGISKTLYTREQMQECHDKLLLETEDIIDDIYYSPYHPSISESLSRKPGTLLFEKAIAKWSIDPAASWMLGDKPTDLIPARKLGMKTIGVKRGRELSEADFLIDDLNESLEIILNGVG